MLACVPAPRRSRVVQFKPGDEVYARPDKDRIGTFAEFIAMNEDDVAIKPKTLTMAEAASSFALLFCQPERFSRARPGWKRLAHIAKRHGRTGRVLGRAGQAL